MEAKGFYGPFAIPYDGILTATFHGPDVLMPLNPPHIEAPESGRFQMSYWDCKQICSETSVFAMGKGADQVERHLRDANRDPEQLRTAFVNSHGEPCLLAYPRPTLRVPTGPWVMAAVMEDLWHIFHYDGYLYFIRSWTGRIRHRARFFLRESAMFVDQVETILTPTDNALATLPLTNDSRFGVRQIDYLLKALLFRYPCLAPIPMSGPSDAPGIAYFALTEYGRVGWYLSVEETTEYRMCLNGNLGKYAPTADNLPLLELIRTASENRKNRQRLLADLQSHWLWFAYTVDQETVNTMAITDDSEITFAAHEWNGQPCRFAYTDPTYAVEPCQCWSVKKGSGITAAVRECSPSALLVVNPGGPFTCVLDSHDLATLVVADLQGPTEASGSR